MARYLGIDCCTKSMNALVIDTDVDSVIYQVRLDYSDLRPGGDHVGVLSSEDNLEKHADPLLWLDGMEEIFRRLQSIGCDFSQIAAVSGSAQQHGTVYLKGGFLKSGWLREDSATLADAVHPLLARATAPIWMDSSTFHECRAIDEAMGGAARVRSITGSSATERFAGPQIRKYAMTDAEGYADTAVIHLVSSFLCSVLMGASAPVDACDAAGMNLMDLEKQDWNPELLSATAPGLLAKLPKIAHTTAAVGTVHPYFMAKYGFRQIPVVTWTGDNPSTLIGAGCYKPGYFVVTLGTSDNFFTASEKRIADPHGYGHLFLNPAGRYLGLNCYKNGSCARELVRKKFDLTWSEFDNDAFDLTMPGNNGNIMLPYWFDEITPQVMNLQPVYEGNSLFKSFKDAASMVRALVEAQAMTMRLHSGWFNQKVSGIRVTGTGSHSRGICQVLADVFNTQVQRLSNNAAASQGAAVRAAVAVDDNETWATMTKRICINDPKQTVKPIRQNVEVYKELLHKYAELEKSITGEELDSSF